MSISLVGGPKDDVFVGRQAELSSLLEVVTRVEEGQPWLVTVEGESGIGKTALVKRGLASARGFRALSARSDQSETDLEYGVIEQLLRNVDVPLLDRYPLLRGDVVRSSAFAVGAELLAVLGEQLATGPIAMVVDDVQWADRPSVDALSFMLRRLSVEPVLVLLVIRGDRDHLDEATRRMLLGVDQRVHLTLAGLALDDIAPLASAIGALPLTAGCAPAPLRRHLGPRLVLEDRPERPGQPGPVGSGQAPGPAVAGCRDRGPAHPPARGDEVASGNAVRCGRANAAGSSGPGRRSGVSERRHRACGQGRVGGPFRRRTELASCDPARACSATVSTPASAPAGAEKCMLAPSLSSTRARPGPTGWPLSTILTRISPSS